MNDLRSQLESEDSTERQYMHTYRSLLLILLAVKTILNCGVEHEKYSKPGRQCTFLEFCFYHNANIDTKNSFCL